MEQLELLEQELKMIQENIKRVKEYQEQNKNVTWVIRHSHVLAN